jgi:hypothetical protein
MFFTVVTAMRSIDSTETPAMWAETIVFGSLSSGLSGGVGSAVEHVDAGAASLPAESAACSALRR